MNYKHPEKEMLDKYFDGILNKEEEFYINEHLKVCGECKKYVDSLYIVSQTMKEIYTDENEKENINRLMAKVKQIKEGKNKRKIEKIIDVVFNSKKTIVAIAASFLIAVVFLFNRNNRINIAADGEAVKVNFVSSKYTVMVYDVSSNDKAVWIFEE